MSHEAVQHLLAVISLRAHQEIARATRPFRSKVNKRLNLRAFSVEPIALGGWWREPRHASKKFRTHGRQTPESKSPASL
jgi:hypothetical protein